MGKAIHFIKSILIAVKTKFSKSKPDEPEVQAETQPEVRPEVEDEANEAIRQRINSSKAEWDYSYDSDCLELIFYFF